VLAILEVVENSTVLTRMSGMTKDAWVFKRVELLRLIIPQLLDLFKSHWQSTKVSDMYQEVPFSSRVMNTEVSMLLPE